MSVYFCDSNRHTHSIVFRLKMDKREEILALLQFSDVIQKSIAETDDPTAVTSLKEDLAKVKCEIGRKVLELPPDFPLFTQQDADPGESPLQDTFDLSDIPMATPVHDPNNLASKFELFLRQKQRNNNARG